MVDLPEPHHLAFARPAVRPASEVAAFAVPLDVHVLRQARNLGLVRTNAATMHTALEITARLDEVFPGDPCKGDFALYGLGIDEQTKTK